jgi:hypothetical protein
VQNLNNPGPTRTLLRFSTTVVEKLNNVGVAETLLRFPALFAEAEKT